jgi:hypothetical protein
VQSALTAAKSALSVLQSVLSDCQDFRAVNTVFCALLLRSLTRNRLNRFSIFWRPTLPLFISLPLSSSLLSLFFTAAVALSTFYSRRRPLILHLHTPLQNLSCPLTFGRVVGDPLIPAFFHHLPPSRWEFLTQSPDRGIALFYFLIFGPTRS